MRDQKASLLAYEGVNNNENPEDALELFKISVYVALDDNLEDFFVPGETSDNLSAISSFIWRVPLVHQYATKSLAKTYHQLPLEARYAHLDWSQVDPQILLNDIQNVKGLQPADFCAILDSSWETSLENFAKRYSYVSSTRLDVSEQFPWRKLARWILRGVSLERLSMKTFENWEGNHLTALFSALFLIKRSPRMCERDTSEFLSMWLEDVQSSGKDLAKYGSQEKEIFMGDKLLQDRRLDVLFDYSFPKISWTGMRLVSFTYGPQPEDWKLVWGLEAEEYAGDFWYLVENPPLRIPGGWVEDD
ncbi:hypothetical protein CORC01_02170 [Colletotrichum orchidophilum]|uniref:Uncharacterized protein n=1 Tax=Colletotrichum orchidophilum TaxID=1209926 RepID=A0A1G4BMC0_9PEZI|nr:uncharacterized protein CORC01_02170 [Colletotrichum orchidophilum]OHF02475.1 hypothetical protein CORC01_02170 [Colletotrichum orchidophilum]